MTLKLYHNDMSSCAQKVRFVLHEKDLEWEGEELDLRAGEQLDEAFLKINPKGLVPTLVHDGNILAESNVIIEYLNEAFPSPALLPEEPLARARVRAWMKKLDDGVHLETIALSFGIAFRHQLIKACGNDEALDAHFARIPDPYVRDIQRQVVHAGIDSPRCQQAIHVFDNLLQDLDDALASQDWVVGDRLSLADIAYGPYATRLHRLHLDGMWNNRPHFARWFDAIQATAGYKTALTQWLNAKYLPLMDDAGKAAWPKIEQLLNRSKG
ncbi:MAG: glutathione S-transferase family protein [Gammaproteobacteria bacterium]